MDMIDLRGQQMPALGFGTWQLTGDACVTGVQKALEIGYRHIDTAQKYENEAQVGQAVVTSGIARSEVFLTTKIWIDNFAPEKLLRSFADSLDSLQTDYVDLLLLHWPNPAIPLADSLTALQNLKDKGQIRNFGVSNFPVALMREAKEILGFDIVCNQIEYHAMLSQRAVLDYAAQQDITVTAYSPLARGNLENSPIMLGIARKHGKSISQIALRWLLDQKGVAAIPKASSEQHIRTNFEIFDFHLNDEDRAQIATINGNHRLICPDFSPQWDQAA